MYIILCTGEDLITSRDGLTYITLCTGVGLPTTRKGLTYITLCTGVGLPESREGRVGPDPRRQGVGAAHLITLCSGSGRREGLTYTVSHLMYWSRSASEQGGEGRA
jgi:hypothetical protein